MSRDCLTCGHPRFHHTGLGNVGECDWPGCTCPRFEATDPAVAGPPPDLQQAIHAATDALYLDARWINHPGNVARVAVEAAWPHMAEQLQAAQADAAATCVVLQAAQAENQQLRQIAEWAEWLGTSTATNKVGSSSFCMACGGYRKVGHQPTCWLHAILKHQAALGQVDQ